jgi:hypothetical protein
MAKKSVSVGEFQEELTQQRNGQQQPVPPTADLTSDSVAALRATSGEDAHDLATWDLDQLRVSPDLTVEISGG